MKFAPEGYPFIAFFAVITAIVFFAGGVIMAAAPFILTLFMAFFFRDPEREIPVGDNIFVSPADGKVIRIQKIAEDTSPHYPTLLKGGKGGFIDGGFIEISIFMSPLNVHVNRAPCDGAVESVVHTAGKFLSAFKPEASLSNENIAMTLKSDYYKILVRQVAGAVARRAVCRVKPGDFLKKGERYGIIKFSSRLDVFLPEKTEISVRPGDKVRAGETIIGRI